MTVRLLEPGDESLRRSRLGNAPERVVNAMQPTFEEHVSRICHWLSRCCESPIEIMLGAGLWIAMNLSKPGSLKFAAPDFIGPLNYPLVVRPQFEWGSYRSDFALCTRTSTILVECDGHNFHERTREQAAHDRRKDREAQAAGYAIFRFTGSEIYQDPEACAAQVMEFAASKLGRDNKTATG